MKINLGKIFITMLMTNLLINASMAGMDSPLEHLPTDSFIRITKDVLIETGTNEIDLGWTFGDSENIQTRCSLEIKSNTQYDRILEKGDIFKVDSVEWLSSHPTDMELKITLEGMPNGDYILFRWDEETNYTAKVRDLHDRCDNLF